MIVLRTFALNREAAVMSRGYWAEFCRCYGYVATKQERKMAASDVDVSSSIDQNEDPIEDLTDEELYSLVEETM